MQVAIRINQARFRVDRRRLLRRHARRLVALGGEVLALASLVVALAAGMMILSELAVPGLAVG